MPEISVIMAVYDTPELESLKKSVASVLEQSFGDFEFLICDDCSGKMDIKEYLRQLPKSDMRIKLFENQKNMGLAASLNRLIEASSPNSGYIFRQDDDDISAPDRFFSQRAFLVDNPGISIVGSNVSLCDGNGVWGVLKYPEKPEKRNFLFAVPFMHGALAFKKSDLLDSGCYLSAKETRRAEDYELLMRMYARGLVGFNIQKELYSFREDAAAHKRRKYRYRLDEAKIRYRGFKMLKLLPQGLLHVAKPLVVGLIPRRLLNFLKDGYYGRRKKT